MPINQRQYGQPRDNQRQRLYTAEEVLHDRRVSRAATKHLIDTQHVAGWRVLDPENPTASTKPMKVPTIAAVQDYVDAVTHAAWFQARWGHRKVTVRPGKGSHGSWGYVSIAQVHRHSEAVILHEIAHGLVGSGCAYHGPEFAGVLLTLVRYQMGKPYADELRASFKKHRVRYTMAEVPAPNTDRVARVRQAAKTRTQQNLGDRLGLSTANQCKVAASVIRTQVKAGLFGPPGCKPRAHALATARVLEGGR